VWSVPRVNFFVLCGGQTQRIGGGDVRDSACHEVGGGKKKSCGLIGPFGLAKLQAAVFLGRENVAVGPNGTIFIFIFL